MKSYTKTEPETTRREWWEDDEPYIATADDHDIIDEQRLLSEITAANPELQRRLFCELETILSTYEQCPTLEG